MFVVSALLNMPRVGGIRVSSGKRCVCVCVCVWMCTFVCMSEYIFVCMSEYVFVCMSVCVCECVQVSRYARAKGVNRHTHIGWPLASTHHLTQPLLSLYYPCTIPVLSLYYPCTIPVLSLYYPCTIPVLSLYYPCTIPVLQVLPSVWEGAAGHPLVHRRSSSSGAVGRCTSWRTSDGYTDGSRWQGTTPY